MSRTSKFVSLTLATALMGCSPSPQPSASPAPGGAQTAIGQAAQKAIAEARTKLETENIKLGQGNGISINGSRNTSNLPLAEITPKGDFIVDGKTVAVDAGQRALLLDYRKHVIDIVSTGMAIGVKGADLAGTAVNEALASIFTGKTDEVEKRVNAQAETLKADAQRICTSLPGMRDTQDKLATALPAFKPYATMTQDDIDNCGKDKNDHVVVRGASSGPNADSDNDSDSGSGSAAAAAAAAAGGPTPPVPPTPPAPPVPPKNDFAKTSCAFQRPINLALDTHGIRTVRFDLESDDLTADAVSGGASVGGRACASSQSALDTMKVEQQRNGDVLTVRAWHTDGFTGRSNISIGPIRMSRYSMMQLQAKVPDNVTVEVTAKSGDVVVRNAARTSLDLGSGDGQLLGVRGDAFAKLGSGDLVVDGARSLRVLSIGSGDAKLQNIAGAVNIDTMGSGDAKVASAGSVEVGTVGSGDVVIGGIRGNVHVGTVGSGDVTANDVQGDLRVDSMGSGDVNHKNIGGKINVPKKNDD
ncbi:MAG: hypothetical protein JSR50_08080 [Proteobacteria bacterium]|nr:hypothetical protein [Pseudomonadota bacterium]